MPAGCWLMTECQLQEVIDCDLRYFLVICRGELLIGGDVLEYGLAGNWCQLKQASYFERSPCGCPTILWRRGCVGENLARILSVCYRISWL